MKRSSALFSFSCALIYVLFFSCPVGSAEVGPAQTQLVLKCPLNSGFGAIFCSVLGALQKYEKENYGGIVVDLDSGVYLDPHQGPNWWEYYFEPINICKENVARTEIITSEAMLDLGREGFLMLRSEAHRLIEKYVVLKPEIQAALDHYHELYFKNCYVIGIHHRGTDKKEEIRLVPYEETLATLQWLMGKLPKSKQKELRLFIATDEQPFIDFMSMLYPGRVVYADFVRSKDSNPLHYSGSLYSSNYQKGKEALLDCLLLALCDCLIVPPFSAFSTMALKFNPAILAVPVKS